MFQGPLPLITAPKLMNMMFISFNRLSYACFAATAGSLWHQSKRVLPFLCCGFGLSSGEMPSLRNLTRLSLVGLNNNRLSGRLRAELFPPMVTTINVASNWFTGGRAVCACVSLRSSALVRLRLWRVRLVPLLRTTSVLRLSRLPTL